MEYQTIDHELDTLAKTDILILLDCNTKKSSVVGITSKKYKISKNLAKRLMEDAISERSRRA